MAWDFGLDPATGDFIFGANHDLMGVSGEDLDRQRISVRLKIPLGTFAYDETELLGSRLRSAQRLPMERGLAEIPKLVEEALEPMEDIDVRSVTVAEDEDDPGKAVVILKYAHSPERSDSRLTADETDELEVTISL